MLIILIYTDHYVSSSFVIIENADWTNHASYHCNKFGVASWPFPTRRNPAEDGALYVGARMAPSHWALTMPLKGQRLIENSEHARQLFRRWLPSSPADNDVPESGTKKDTLLPNCPVQCRPEGAGELWAYC